MKTIAVVGSGYWGKNLVRVFAELGALHTVCDTDASRLGAVKIPGSGVRRTASLDEVLEDKEIQAVAVATPAETHFEVGRKALLAGKHLFMEKPLCLKVDEGAELVRLARERGRTLAVGHVLHYHPSIVRMKELIKQGEIGKVDYVYSNRLNLGKFRNEENILWSFAPHDISLILSLLNEYPGEVFCTGASYLHKKIADVTLCSYTFESGAKAHIFVSWLHPTKEQRVVVVGSNGMMVFDDTQEPEKKLALYRHKVIWQDGLPTPQRNEAEFPTIVWSEPLRNECQAFIDAVASNEPMLTNGEEGLQTLRLLNDSQESLMRNEILRPRRAPAATQNPSGFFVHESSYCDAAAKVGPGSKIWHFCNVMAGAQIGSDCSIGQNVFIAKNVRIGDRVKIQNNVSVYEGVEVDDNAFLGPSMVFTNVFNPRSEIERKHEYRKTLVGRGVTIGANATIVCGNPLGEYAFVGAGAVVTKPVPPYALMVGSPARQRGWVCRCAVKLSDDTEGAADGACLECGECGTVYRLHREGDSWRCRPEPLRQRVDEAAPPIR